MAVPTPALSREMSLRLFERFRAGVRRTTEVGLLSKATCIGPTSAPR